MNAAFSLSNLHFLTCYSLLNKSYKPCQNDSKSSSFESAFPGRIFNLLDEIRSSDPFEASEDLNEQLAPVVKKIGTLLEDFFSYIRSHKENLLDYDLVFPLFHFADEIKRNRKDNFEIWEHLSSQHQRFLHHISPLTTPPHPDISIISCNELNRHTTNQGTVTFGDARQFSFSNVSREQPNYFVLELEEYPQLQLCNPVSNPSLDYHPLVIDEDTLKTERFGRSLELFDLIIHKNRSDQSSGVYGSRSHLQAINLFKFYRCGILETLGLPVSRALAINSFGDWHILEMTTPIPLPKIDFDQLNDESIRLLAKDIQLHMLIEKSWGINILGMFQHGDSLAALFFRVGEHAIMDNVALLPTFLTMTSNEIDQRHALMIKSLESCPKLHAALESIDTFHSHVSSGNKFTDEFLQRGLDSGKYCLEDILADNPSTVIYIRLTDLINDFYSSKNVPLPVIQSWAARNLNVVPEKGKISYTHSRENTQKALNFNAELISNAKILENFCIVYLLEHFPHPLNGEDIIKEVYKVGEELIESISLFLRKLPELDPKNSSIWDNGNDHFMVSFGEPFLNKLVHLLNGVANREDFLENRLRLLHFVMTQPANQQIDRLNISLQDILHEQMIAKAKIDFALSASKRLDNFNI